MFSARIVLAVIGDDRARLVHALSDVVSRHSGNWERNQMAERASSRALSSSRYLPERTDELTAALPRPSGGLGASRCGRRHRQKPRNSAWICWATTGPKLLQRCHRSCIVTSVGETMETLTRIEGSDGRWPTLRGPRCHCGPRRLRMWRLCAPISKQLASELLVERSPAWLPVRQLTSGFRLRLSTAVRLGTGVGDRCNR